MTTSNWSRVRRSHPCPICERPDWCLITGDGSAAICQRVESNKPVGTKGAGWLHKLSDEPLSYGPASQPKLERVKPQRDWAALAARYQVAMTQGGYKYLSVQLGVSIESLHRLQVGWHGSGLCSTWPMRDATGVVVGIRTRSEDAKKSVSGTDGNGLFFDADSLSSNYLLICEGPTDTAALFDCGFNSCVGRPSCRGGTEYIIKIIKRLQPKAVLLIPDNDQAGLSGFGELAAAIASAGNINLGRLDAITPPPGVNDIRQWAQKNRDHLTGRIAAKLKLIKQRTETSND